MVLVQDMVRGWSMTLGMNARVPLEVELLLETNEFGILGIQYIYSTKDAVIERDFGEGTSVVRCVHVIPHTGDLARVCYAQN